MLRLTTFGGLGLSKDGTPLTGVAAQRSRLSLLALLATAGPAGISRDRLLLLLWPESDADRARHALKQAVYSLRRELESDDVIVGTASLSLNAQVIASDVQEFEAAVAANDFERAASIYTGPFLDGVHLRDAAEFEHWCDEQRARYAHQWTHAVEQLAAACESQGAWGEAAGRWRSLLSTDALNGRLTEALMRALAESGESAAAIRQYRIFETLLREEVGTKPEASLTLLSEALLNGTWKPSSPRERSAVHTIAGNSLSTHASSVDSAKVSSEHIGPTVAATNADSTQLVVPSSRPARDRLRSPAVTFGLGALVVLLLALAIPYARTNSDTKAEYGIIRTRANAVLEPRQIVVAPFENKTGDASLDALGEQIADWFARELSEAGFKVVDARTARIGTRIVEGIPTVLRARDTHIALGEETGSAYAIVGSYYRQGDSLEANISVIDVATKQAKKSLGPYHGSARNADAFIGTMLKPTIGYLASDVDSSAGALTMKYSSPPSLEAFTRTSRAWERFFGSPGDTAPVFAQLDSASRIDPEYATPLLMKGYILDVKSNWPELAKVVARTRPLVLRMSRQEKAAFDLLDTDLRGDAIARLAIAKRLREVSPGSGEMPLLMVVSALYVGRTADAVAALSLADPHRGVNLVAPTYLEWAGLARHYSNNEKEEEALAREQLRRFRYHPAATQALVMLLARRNDKSLRTVVDQGIPRSSGGDTAGDAAGDRQDLMLLAARELRAHGHSAAADTFFRAVASELASIPANASLAQMRRQAHALYEIKEFARAERAFEAIAARDTSDIESEGRMATSAAHLGDTSTVLRVQRKLTSTQGPFLMGLTLRWRANIAAVEGRHEEAVALLEQAVRQGHRLIDTPMHLTVHLDGDYLETMRQPAFAGMLRSLAEAGVR